MHSMMHNLIADIVHRDLKLENILLSKNDADPDDRFNIKVRDVSELSNLI